MNLFERIHRKLVKMRLEPVVAFVFHQVSDMFDPYVDRECDWIHIESFKNKIIDMKKEYTFISLEKASNVLRKSFLRRKKYAVLTVDDGYLSVLNVIPFLEEQNIPLAMFINARYLDKQSYSPLNLETAKSFDPNCNMNDIVGCLYISKEQLFQLNSPLISIGMHGYEHLDSTQMTKEQFETNVDKCAKELSNHKRFIPYYAYTWGRWNKMNEEVLRKYGFVPVLCDGRKNYNNYTIISRTPL